MTSGVGANGTSAKYTYLADGTKVDVRDSSNNGFSYLGSLVYKKVGGSLLLESAPFAGGRIEKSISGYDVNYYVTDHLGSVRAVLDGDGMVQGRNDYLPFGESWSAGGQSSSGGSAASTRYKFNGKELQTTGGVDLLDYGARMYDSNIGRWLTQDPLAEKYFSMSSYNYCANNPINAIDPDGELVIFINGMHTGDGGSSKYWSGFDKKVMAHLNDNNALYYDGSSGGVGKAMPGGLFSPNFTSASSNSRYFSGYNMGCNEAEKILKTISGKKGIKEKIKIITHSMGAAYAKGFINGLLQNGVPLEAIEFEADFAPFQPTAQKVVRGVTTYQFSSTGDDVASNFWLTSPLGKIEGAIYHKIDDPDIGHSIGHFESLILSLPAGNYKVEDGKIIRVN